MKNYNWLVENKTAKPKWLESKNRPLAQNEVRIENHYSSINYKDALGFSGKGKIFRSYPMVPGIDLAGIVIESKSAKHKVGSEVIVTGTGMGEDYFGAYATTTVVSEENIVLKPDSMSLKQAMVLGTAGFTAALAIERILALGPIPTGEILVTGASGGVGSFSCLLLNKKGFNVHALSGKSDMLTYLKRLGANTVSKPEDIKWGERPLEKILFSACIDNVGGSLLEKIIKHIDLYGSVASVGLAGGDKVATTIMPFILRGVSILGISSNNCPMPLREKIWQNLAEDLTLDDYKKISVEEIDIQAVPQHVERFFQREISGRLLVKIK